MLRVIIATAPLSSRYCWRYAAILRFIYFSSSPFTPAFPGSKPPCPASIIIILFSTGSIVYTDALFLYIAVNLYVSRFIFFSSVKDKILKTFYVSSI